MKKDIQIDRANYLDIFNSLPDRAFIIDPKDYTILDVNKAYLQKEGLTKKDVIGRKCYEVIHRRLSPCKGAFEKCSLKETLRTHKAAIAEHIHYDKHSNPYYVDVVTSPIKGASGEKDLILHICRVGPILKRLHKVVDEKSKRYAAHLRHLAIKDPLTGVYNYRYLMERLPQEVYRAKRYNYPFSLALLDIDYFKSINDVYGHSIGDRLLSAFANFIQTSLRQSDVLTRYGGEEFVILMTHTDKLGAQYLPNRLIANLSSHIFKIKKMEIKLKIGIGIATLSSDEDCDTYDKLLSAADKALQRAKDSGSNVAVAYSDLYREKKEAAHKMSPYKEVNVLKRKIRD